MATKVTILKEYETVLSNQIATKLILFFLPQSEIVSTTSESVYNTHCRQKFWVEITTTKSLLIWTEKNLSTHPPWDFWYVLNTINPYWVCLDENFCPQSTRTSCKKLAQIIIRNHFKYRKIFCYLVWIKNTEYMIGSP